MRVTVQNTLTNRQWTGFEGQSGFLIGRDASCDLKLESRFIAPVHARVERAEGGWELEVMPGANPVTIDGKELKAGQKQVLKSNAVIRLVEFVLRLEEAQRDDVLAATSASANIEAQITDIINVLHATVLRRLDLRLGAWTRVEGSTDRTETLNLVVDDMLLGEFKSQVLESPITPVMLKRALKTRMLDWVVKKFNQEVKIQTTWTQVGINPENETLLEGILGRMATRMGIIEGKPLPSNAEDVVELQFETQFNATQQEMLDNLRVYLVVAYIKKILYDIIFGLGPLEDMLRSPSITEIMVVKPNLIYIERGGRITKVPYTFPSEESAISVIERIVSPLGRRIDRSQPLVDARLRDGSRVNAIIEPLAIKGPCITIRKFPQTRVTVEDMIRWRTLTRPAVALLRACVQYRCSMLVSGGTGTGKTTLLNALSGMIPSQERVVTIEDSAELRLHQEHVVSLETKQANAEGVGEYNIRSLVKNALRMRPDRIIVGECRGDEVIDMLQAMNTGHRGSMTTLHANSAADAMSRLETMVLMGAEIPLQAVRRQISTAIEIIVHLERMPNGGRVVSQISEIIGIHPQTGEIETRDIMVAQADKNGLALRPTGYMPRFLPDMVEKGFLQLQSWFEQVKVG